jgi:hypothetical protein
MGVCRFIGEASGEHESGRAAGRPVTVISPLVCERLLLVGPIGMRYAVDTASPAGSFLTSRVLRLAPPRETSESPEGSTAMSWFRPKRERGVDVRREDEDGSLRWSALRQSSGRLDGADPEEVESRIRRLSHGTYRA